MSVEYKMKPVRRIISKLVKFEDGIPNETLSLAFQFRIISENEYRVIRMIKEHQQLNVAEKSTQIAVDHLLKKNLIIKSK